MYCCRYPVNAIQILPPTTATLSSRPLCYVVCLFSFLPSPSISLPQPTPTIYILHFIPVTKLQRLLLLHLHSHSLIKHETRHDDHVTTSLIGILTDTLPTAVFPPPRHPPPSPIRQSIKIRPFNTT